MYRCADKKISKTENSVTVTYRDVENLDHQNWQLLEGKSYITSISIIKQKISYKKNRAGSGFRRKIERDGGIQTKKGGKAGFGNPYCGPSGNRHCKTGENMEFISNLLSTSRNVSGKVMFLKVHLGLLKQFPVVCCFFGMATAWENSPHFATPPLVSLRNDVETSAEFPYWWRVTTQIWLVLLIGRAAWKICFGQSYALTRSGQWSFISMEFLRSFPRRHFARKPVVASPNVSCFLRLGWQSNLKN